MISISNREFKLYSQLTTDTIHHLKKNLDTQKNSDDEERILLTGVASTTNRDLQNDVVSSDAIQMMAEQAGNLNIHGDHWYGLEDVIGAIKNVNVESDVLSIEFLITKKYTPAVKDLLETGVNLGLSIGGYVTDYDETANIIKAIELREISLTAMPANWDTFGTVTTKKGIVESTCLTGACYNIIKNLNGESNMTQEENSIKAEESQETPITLEDVKNFLDEYMAEKEATMVEEVTNNVKTNVESIVESKVKELLDEQPEEESTEETPAEEDNKAAEPPVGEEETEEEEEEEDEDTSKSIPDPDVAITVPEVDIEKAIAKGVAKALGDDFEDRIAAKMFSNMDQTRTPQSSKFDQYMKSQTEPVEEPTNKSTYSTKETAQVLLQKQQAANPIMAAAMKNLK